MKLIELQTVRLDSSSANSSLAGVSLEAKATSRLAAAERVGGSSETVTI